MSTDVPVVVGNDASFAATYEDRYGAGRGARTCLYTQRVRAARSGVSLGGAS